MNPQNQIAHFLRYLASAIESYDPDLPISQSTPAPASPGYTSVPEPDPRPASTPSPSPSEESPKVELSDLQAIAKDLIINGHREEFIQFLASIGMKNLSSVAPKDYPGVLQGLRSLRGTLDA